MGCSGAHKETLAYPLHNTESLGSGPAAERCRPVGNTNARVCRKTAFVLYLWRQGVEGEGVEESGVEVVEVGEGSGGKVERRISSVAPPSPFLLFSSSCCILSFFLLSFL